MIAFDVPEEITKYILTPTTLACYYEQTIFVLRHNIISI